jgi:hypothetical protein
MTVIATSIPVLRVFFKQVVSSAMETHQNASSQDKSRTDPGNPRIRLTHASIQKSSKNATGTIESISKESLVDVSGRRPTTIGMELDDLVVDEKTGRVTAATPESLRDSLERHVSHWPL